MTLSTTQLAIGVIGIVVIAVALYFCLRKKSEDTEKDAAVRGGVRGAASAMPTFDAKVSSSGIFKVTKGKMPAVGKIFTGLITTQDGTKVPKSFVVKTITSVASKKFKVAQYTFGQQSRSQFVIAPTSSFVSTISKLGTFKVTAGQRPAVDDQIKGLIGYQDRKFTVKSVSGKTFKVVESYEDGKQSFAIRFDIIENEDDAADGTADLTADGTAAVDSNMKATEVPCTNDAACGTGQVCSNGKCECGPGYMVTAS